MISLNTNRETAIALDKKDPLYDFRKRFYLLANKIYLDGNSLGLLLQDAEVSLLKLLDQ